MALTNKKIVLGITGSIAASKCIDLIKRLLAKQVELKVVLTKAAENFVTPAELKEVMGNDEVYLSSDLFGIDKEMLHIELARFPDLILIAPISANLIAKLSNGFADDLLSSVCLASSSKIAVAPAMNQQMWRNAFTQINITKLGQNNIHIIGPAEGWQACGDYGYGRMSEPKQIVKDLEQYFASANLLAGKRVVITAGPTIEKIDAVRYISNFSSGKMGYAMAKAAEQFGAQVILISGPTNLPKPSGVQIEYINSASDMLAMTLKYTDNADIFISCAAVADYTPVTTHSQKLKKSLDNLHLDLKPTIDIVKEVANLNKKPYVVGFAAETDDLLHYANGKLKAKNLDMIIANDVSDNMVFGNDDNQVYIMTKHSSEATLIPKQSKENIAMIILQHVVLKLAEA
jgi:phosphopantothenoylcysteine decarboxylase/phosphopantothenate--cysteine ligase